MAIEHYDDKFFKVRKGYIGRVPIMCQGIIDIWNPKTLLDLGAAIGDTVQGYIDRGVDTKGIEGSASCIPYLVCDPSKISIQDLSKPLDPLPPKWESIKNKAGIKEPYKNLMVWERHV